MQATPNPFMSLIPIAAVFAIFYFLLIRPQQKQAEEHKKMLETLQKGDRVVTSGGFYGVIAGFKGADVELKIAENVKVLVTRSSISQKVTESTAATANNSVATAA